MVDKFAIARALREIGSLLEAKGENPFKIRAYERGARAIEDLAEDIEALFREGRLTDVPGIGEALSQKISDFVATGHIPLLDRLRSELPAGIHELLEIPDLGPRKIAQLHQALGIDSVVALKAACEQGRVREVKGFGRRTEERILEGIRRLETRGPRRALLSDAVPIAERLVTHLRASPAVERADIAGSLRRWKETVADLDLVAASREPAAVGDHFVRAPLVESVMASGDTKTAVRLAGGLHADVRVVPPAEYAMLLHHLTGSQAHLVRLRGLARERGLTLSDGGLARVDTAEKIPVESEPELYRRLGLQYVPPELREDQGEIEAALAGTLPEDLVEISDVRGMVHCHTRWSDGRATIEEMARAAEAMGMDYLTITDHSPTAAYAGGLTADRLEAQWEEIARVQEKVRIQLLRGTECDILDDGALDFSDDILERLDVVVASIHSRHKMDADQMTERLVRAMRQPVFKIWGHALGRLLGEREPFACRVGEVLDAAASSPAAIEVNGDPRRLEMEPQYLRMARERGLTFVLAVDAHSTEALGYLRFAVATARRGWVRRGEVLNALPADAFRAAVRPAR